MVTFINCYRMWRCQTASIHEFFNVRYVLMGYNVVLHVVVQAESLPTVLVHQVLGLVPTAAVSHQARKG